MALNVSECEEEREGWGFGAKTEQAERIFIGLGWQSWDRTGYRRDREGTGLVTVGAMIKCRS